MRGNLAAQAKGLLMSLKIRNPLKRLHGDQRGLTTVEYAIVLCLIAAVSVVAWKTFGQNVSKYLASATKTIDGAMH
jgi:Flp pilus assembly pilin Flp